MKESSLDRDIVRTLVRLPYSEEVDTFRLRLVFRSSSGSDRIGIRRGPHNACVLLDVIRSSSQDGIGSLFLFSAERVPFGGSPVSCIIDGIVGSES